MCNKLHYPYGERQIQGVIKFSPEDFRVCENLGFEPSGDGEHLFLFVEKTGLTTQQLIEALSRSLEIPLRQIAHSGLKDKQAITRQWLSLHLPGKSLSSIPEIPGCQVLKQIRNRSKLRPGTHKSNHFEICIRQLSHFPESSIDQINAIRVHGFANYFGQQRFGKQGDNVEQALCKLQNRGLRRHQRSLLISALRSELFNQIVSRRIESGHWKTPLEGDVFMLRGSHSIFTESLDDDILRRYQSLDISSCASLYGRGSRRFSEQAELLEQTVFASRRDITECLDQQSTKLAMRSIRAKPENLVYEYDETEKCLRLSLELPTGCYLTSLLDHFIDCQESQRR